MIVGKIERWSDESDESDGTESAEPTARDFPLDFQEFSYTLLGKLQAISKSIIDRYYKWINDFDYEKDYDAFRCFGSDDHYTHIVLHDICRSRHICRNS